MTDHWFEELADHMGSAYLRYSFTKGTRQEIDFLVEVFDIAPGQRVLDVGCGPGRHSHELARRGVRAHGVDVSATFIDLARHEAPEGATFERLDARHLTMRSATEGGTEFDVSLCLCQGAFGLMRQEGEDLDVLRGMARHTRVGGRLALSAFSAYYSVRYQTEAQFDALSGVCHERTTVRDQAGVGKDVSLWTGCYTPRELGLLLPIAGWTLDRIYSVEPGAYGTTAPTVESPEFLVLATRA